MYIVFARHSLKVVRMCIFSKLLLCMIDIVNLLHALNLRSCGNFHNCINIFDNLVINLCKSYTSSHLLLQYAAAAAAREIVSMTVVL